MCSWIFSLTIGRYPIPIVIEPKVKWLVKNMELPSNATNAYVSKMHECTPWHSNFSGQRLTSRQQLGASTWHSILTSHSRLTLRLDLTQQFNIAASRNNLRQRLDLPQDLNTAAWLDTWQLGTVASQRGWSLDTAAWHSDLTDLTNCCLRPL